MSSLEESNYQSSLEQEFIWECQTNVNPWDKRQTQEWTPYSNAQSVAIEEAYKRVSKEILINENYRIDLKSFVQQYTNDPYRQRPVRRRRFRPPSTISLDEETEDESLRRERLSSPLGLVFSCSTTEDTTCYGPPFVHTWLLMFTKGKMKVTFNAIYAVLLRGLITEGETDRNDQLIQIKEALINVEKETDGISSGKRIKKLEVCCAKLYTKSSHIYRVVNTALRDDDRTKLYTLGPFCYLLFTYIGRLFNDHSSIHHRLQRVLRSNQIESTILYRGDRSCANIIEEYRQAAGDSSKHFKWLPFVSTSRDRMVAERFSVDMLYIIEMRSYSSNEDQFTDLTKISEYKHEQEILLLPGVQFIVNKLEFDNCMGRHLVYTTINSSYISKLK